MILSLIGHEVRYRMRQLSTHVYAVLFFALAFLTMNALGGAFGEGQIAVMGTGPNTHVNGPYYLGMMTFLLSFLGVVITSPFMGQAVYRDFDSGVHSLMFTTPVTKAQYLGGRFLGSVVVHLYLYAGITAGLMLGTVVPWVETTRMGAFSLTYYLQPYLVFVLPNLLFTGAIFFSLSTLTRRMLPNYVGGVLLLMGYNIASVLMNADAIINSSVAALLDPFGQIAAFDITRYWTVAEQNAQVIPLEGMFLWNRLLWMGVGVAALAVCYWRFEFTHVAGGSSSSGDESDEPASLAEMSPASVFRSVSLPSVTLSFGRSARWKQFLSLTRRAFTGIVRDVYFYAIVTASVIFLLVSASEAGSIYGTPVLPVTYHILDTLNSGFTLFMIILITFYAGQLVWQERDVEAEQLYDTLPLPSGVPLAAKGTALVAMCAVLMLVVLVTGVGTQLAYGFSDVDFGLYVADLFGIQLVDYALLCVLAMAVHAVVNHKYVGHFIMVVYFLAVSFSGQLGLEHNLYQFGSDPGIPYSDMNGFGHFAAAFAWHKLLWAAVAVIMAVLARLAWVRGTVTTVAERLRTARRRLTTPVLTVLGAAGVVAMATGFYIVLNTTVWNTYRTSDAQERLQAEYEQTYEAWTDVPQPRVAAVDFDVDLYPDRRDARLAGTYTLVNDHDEPVDSLHVEFGAGMEVDRFEIDRSVASARHDSVHAVRILHLDRPLAPGDSMQAAFEVAYRTRGFTNDGTRTAVVGNGTFINSTRVPRFGYNENAELSSRSTREKYGLDEEPRRPPATDTTARMRPYVSRDATWLRYEATVRTSADQIALAPGELDSTWTETGPGGRERSVYRYRTTAPTLNFFSFLSARYDVRRATWTPPTDSTTGQPLNEGRPVDVEVYFHPEHPYNVDRMIEAVKRSLTYYTRHFGPYQSDQVRIAEFPRYATFAQSFLGTIPYSESIGFIARVDDENDIDYPYYVTAHEMAHQWWAHQVIGGPVQGTTMLTETLSQYSALMVMEETYGPKQMRRFLEYELDQYLTGRTQESRQEQPLVAVEDQSYIHYRKGSVVMYALQDYLGEETVNRVLGAFVRDYRFQEPPYVTADELVSRFEAAAPDSLRPMVSDLFRTIKLYDNRAVNATATPTGDGRYRVDVTVDARKLQADSLGSETEVEMNDYVEVGVFATEADVGADEQRVLYLQKHRLTGGEQTITVTVGEEPARAGVDPYVKLIDRNTGDNLTEVSME